MFVIIVVVAFDTVVFSRFGPACRSATPRFSLAERQGSSPVKSLLGDNALLHVFFKREISETKLLATRQRATDTSFLN